VIVNAGLFEEGGVITVAGRAQDAFEQAKGQRRDEEEGEQNKEQAAARREGGRACRAWRRDRPGGLGRVGRLGIGARFFQ